MDNGAVSFELRLTVFETFSGFGVQANINSGVDLKSLGFFASAHVGRLSKLM